MFLLAFWLKYVICLLQKLVFFRGSAQVLELKIGLIPFVYPLITKGIFLAW